MARTKMVNGEVIPFTPEEELERDAEDAQAVAEKEAEESAKIVKQEKLDSGKSKLEGLGLTTEEVKEAFGL